MAANRRTPTTPTTTPPPGAFSVSQRLLRGYGPLAVFAILLLLMATLVPSKSPQNVSTTDDASLNSSPGDTSDTVAGTDGTTDTSAVDAGAPGVTTPGQQAAGGTSTRRVAGSPGASTPGGAPAKGAPVGAGVRPCPDRKDQVPGDPYTPPCISFSGDNGGATSRGVNATEIHVAFRVLNEKGFQQTLAELAGASLSDTPDDIKRTIAALSEFFNKRYQIYPRKIVFDFYHGAGP